MKQIQIVSESFSKTVDGVDIPITKEEFYANMEPVNVTYITRDNEILTIKDEVTE
jgi:hypothetical protein